MYKNYNFLEITEDNEYKYLPQTVELEKIVLDKMNKEGKTGQLFITGKDGISEYVHSKENCVMVATEKDEEQNNEKIISAAYITQGQVPFTYNDVTKYFKSGEEYQNYVRSKYNRKDFERMIRKIYIDKICAYKYSRDVILKDYCKAGNIEDLSEDRKNYIFMELVENEHTNENNKFHEKSEIRDKLNKYMSLYMKYVKKEEKEYEDFYWLNFESLSDNLSEIDVYKDVKKSNYRAFDSAIKAYDKILEYEKYKIYSNSNCKNAQKYYNANTNNTIELDTYITHPENRRSGIARILVLEGLKKSLKETLKKKDNEQIFLTSTLHQDNLSSKYVSDFFGLKDYLFVNRRNGRDRQVHIFGMNREDVPNYIEKMEKKIAVLYGYNPHNIVIKDDEKNEIINEQLTYELNELNRLSGIKNLEKKQKFSGYIKGKKSKIEYLKNLQASINRIKQNNNDEPEL